MITEEEQNKLKKVAYEVIKDEGLTMPTRIRFRTSLSGAKSRKGSITHNKKTDEYSITLNTTMVNFVEDKNGTFKNKRTGKKYVRAIMGKEVTFDDIKATLAHEIAHLKFFKHKQDHKDYTECILGKMNKKLEAC